MSDGNTSLLGKLLRWGKNDEGQGEGQGTAAQADDAMATEEAYAGGRGHHSNELSATPHSANQRYFDQLAQEDRDEYEQDSSSLDMRTVYQGNDGKIGLADFELLRVIGRGNFGKVMLVRNANNGRLYAMKSLRKKRILKKKRIQHTRSERNVLAEINYPFVVSLFAAFQSSSKLYLVMDYHSGGDLFWHLQREGKFSPEKAQFYLAELVLALEHLHSLDIVYRDLKAENVLLTAEGHICLTDFGLAKEAVGDDDLSHSYCGTLPYMSPEMLNRKGHGKAVDWWGLGVLGFEMLTGLHPFYDESDSRCKRNIISRQLQFPPGLSKHARSLIRGLLDRDVQGRLDHAAGLHEHPFFAGIDWDAMEHMEVEPPFIPQIDDEDDVSYFDQEITEGDPVDSYVEPHLTYNFEGFSYVSRSQTYDRFAHFQDRYEEDEGEEDDLEDEEDDRLEEDEEEHEMQGASNAVGIPGRQERATEDGENDMFAFSL